MGEKKTNPNLNDAMCTYNKAYFETDHTEEQPLVILCYKTLQKMCIYVCIHVVVISHHTWSFRFCGKYKVYSILSDVHLTVYVTTHSSFIKHSYCFQFFVIVKHLCS